MMPGPGETRQSRRCRFIFPTDVISAGPQAPTSHFPKNCCWYYSLQRSPLSRRSLTHSINHSFASSMVHGNDAALCSITGHNHSLAVSAGSTRLMNAFRSFHHVDLLCRAECCCRFQVTGGPDKLYPGRLSDERILHLG